VLVDDAPVEKPGTRVAETARLRLRGPTRRFVSRGGEKLRGALDAFGIDLRGLRCLDVGASTGGFTDCLLQAGAAHVVAVDVGYGQLDHGLRRDSRVFVLDRTHAAKLAAEQLPGPVDLVTVDVSFISATRVLAHVAQLLPDAQVLVLVKPQFEVGRERVGKGGVVRAEADRREAVDAVARAARCLGYQVRGQSESCLPGPKGNREVFLWLAPRGGSLSGDPVEPERPHPASQVR
jgi:23S rRNA (cytidine1920-2'-O)/16S rRNA (cytidine1409-2'-O)-methyltransferase